MTDVCEIYSSCAASKILQTDSTNPVCLNPLVIYYEQFNITSETVFFTELFNILSETVFFWEEFN